MRKIKTSSVVAASAAVMLTIFAGLACAEVTNLSQFTVNAGIAGEVVSRRIEIETDSRQHITRFSFIANRVNKRDDSFPAAENGTENGTGNGEVTFNDFSVGDGDRAITFDLSGLQVNGGQVRLVLGGGRAAMTFEIRWSGQQYNLYFNGQPFNWLNVRSGGRVRLYNGETRIYETRFDI